MRWLPIVLLVVGAVPCPGQESARAHGSMFFELGGNAAFGASMNFEVFLAGPLGVRGGVGKDVFSGTPVYPLQVVLLSGAGRSKLELAAGVTIAHEDPAYSGNWHWDGTKPFANGFLGYRYQRPRGFMFRIGVVPLLWTNAHIPWVAIGLGTTF
jgi:hypothetical protein